MLINGREKVGITKLKNAKTFIDYSQTVDDVYEKLEDYSPTKKKEVLIVFVHMIQDMEANKILSPIVTELFLRGKKFNFSLLAVSQSYFKEPETKRLRTTLSWKYAAKENSNKQHQTIRLTMNLKIL